MGIDELLACVPATVSTLDNISLSKPVLEEEIVDVVKQLNPIKLPGSNGFTDSVFQQF